MPKFLLILFIMALGGCKSETDAGDRAEKAIDTTAFQASVAITEPGLKLEADARKYALNWVEFITAQNEINRLKELSVNEVMNNAGEIAQIMESLKNSVPDSLAVVPVEARLNVVNTKAQLLKQYSVKRDPSAGEITKTTRELYEEFNNLKLQMNEIFLKSLEDFERELDEIEKAEREQDSLANLKKDNLINKSIQ